MGHDLLTAFALLLILEGLLPLLAPRAWIRYVLEAAKLGPQALRIIGIILVLTGAVMLQLLI